MFYWCDSFKVTAACYSQPSSIRYPVTLYEWRAFQDGSSSVSQCCVFGSAAGSSTVILGSWIRIRIRIKVKRRFRIRIRIKVKGRVQISIRIKLKGGSRSPSASASEGRKDPDPNLDPHQSEKQDPATSGPATTWCGSANTGFSRPQYPHFSLFFLTFRQIRCFFRSSFASFLRIPRKEGEPVRSSAPETTLTLCEELSLELTKVCTVVQPHEVSSILVPASAGSAWWVLWAASA
jgi:hypothetical protein